MTRSTSRYPSDLPNKPLVEAIFELRWELQPMKGIANGPLIDPGFRFLLGRYFDRVKERYAHVRELPAASIPEDLAPYVVRHQFRASADGWPVTQLGPGILTVNETHNYRWETFRPLILDAACAVFETYPQVGESAFRPSSALLRYQNALPYDPEATPPREFLREKLHTTLEIDPDIFRSPGGVQEPEFVNVTAVFPLNELPGEANLQLASGATDSGPAIILDISVRTKGSGTPSDRKTLKSWLGRAHDIAESWFFTLCRGELRSDFEEARR